MNHLSAFFTLMSCTGKRHVFYKQGEVLIFCKYVLEFFDFWGKPRKTKNAGCIHMFSVTSLKFLIANWDALIPFLVSFFFLKWKSLLLIFIFYLCARSSWLSKVRGLGQLPQLHSLKPPVLIYVVCDSMCLH